MIRKYETYKCSGLSRAQGVYRRSFLPVYYTRIPLNSESWEINSFAKDNIEIMRAGETNPC